MPEMTVYGTSWCVASWDVRRLLERIGVAFRFVDLDADAEANAWVQSLAPQRSALPVIRWADGTVLVGASRSQIATRYGLRLDTGLLKMPSSMASESDTPSPKP